jgi:hypothetical protein
MWGFGIASAARPAGAAMGPVQTWLNALSLGFYQWNFLLM